MNNYKNYFFILMLFAHGFALADESTNQSNNKPALNTDSVFPDKTPMLTGATGQFGFGSHINDRAFLKKKARATKHKNLQQTPPTLKDEKTATDEQASKNSASATPGAIPHAIEFQSTKHTPKPISPNAHLKLAPNAVN